MDEDPTVARTERLTWVVPPPTDGSSDEPAGDRFLRLACLTWSDDEPSRRERAAELAAAHPDLARASAAVAAVLAQPAILADQLAADPGAATRRSGPYGWTPLMYLAYARIDRIDVAPTVEVARLLLDAGADPNDGRLFNGLVPPFTALTGVIGGGETDQPPHPDWSALARLLLERGADPNDGQALYNRMFTENDDFLNLLFEFGLGQGDGGPWRARRPEDMDPPPALLRSLLGWAVTNDQRDRVQLLARHGVDVRSPLAGIGPLPVHRTPIELALMNGHQELADQLRALGADEPVLDPVDAFVAAVLADDEAAVAGTPAEVVASAQAARPGLVVWAAGQQRLGAVTRLVSLGWDVDAYGRSDAPVEQPWQTALHTAVERNDPELVRGLLRLGADPTRRDARFDGTPLDWAGYLGHPELLPLFES